MIHKILRTHTFVINSYITLICFCRVKFGDDPLGLHQPHIYTALNDTSLKMNQLAAKYLKGQPTLAYKEPVKPTTPEPRPADMSIATRNYMERYKLLEGKYFQFSL